MISEATYPKTKSDLVRALQRMSIDRIKIIEPFDESRKQDVESAIRELNRSTGEVTVIVLRSR
jgi:hypothetical protein